MKIQIKSKVKDSWQNTANNKLRTVKAIIEPYQYSSFCYREWEVKLCRLKIGHSRITHGYLMEAANCRYCEDCLVPLTIEHLLIDALITLMNEELILVMLHWA